MSLNFLIPHPDGIGHFPQYQYRSSSQLGKTEQKHSCKDNIFDTPVTADIIS